MEYLCYVDVDTGRHSRYKEPADPVASVPLYLGITRIHTIVELFLWKID